MIKFPGDFLMKKLAKVIFVYQDGTSDKIEDPRAALMFQSRCNGNGLLTGMEDFIVSENENKPETA